MKEVLMTNVLAALLTFAVITVSFILGWLIGYLIWRKKLR